MASNRSKKKKKKKGSWMAGRPRGVGAGIAIQEGKVLSASDKSFRELVLRSPVPVLVDFWAEWCAPCRQMAPILDELAEQFAGMARVVKLNIEKNRKTPERYDVRSIPTMLVFKEGEILQTFVGATSKGELSKVLAWAMGEP